MLQHEDRKEFMVIEGNGGVSLIETLIVVLCFNSDAVNSAEIPTRFKTGGDDACREVAVDEEFSRSCNKKAIQEKGREGRFPLADVEIARSRKHGIERLRARN